VDVLRDLDGTRPGAGVVATIGVYDGVHVGHRVVIRAAQDRARELGLRCAVVTFEPHPARILRPESAPPLLTLLDHKLELLAEIGVDLTMVVPFDEVRAAETPAEFVEEILVDRLGVRAVVVGQDFHFGKDRAGNLEVLSALGDQYGFEVVGLPLLARPDGTVESVSSTAIRRALAGGDVTTATRLLGRAHEVRGIVTRGDERGRAIGFPTANVEVPNEQALPADGVYAGWYLRPDGVRRPAAINLGRRPTFYEHADHSLLEAHLIDFDGDLHGEPARIQFVSFLRSEIRFAGIDALRQQLTRDVEVARGVLAAAADRPGGGPGPGR
jgi:riboflavin kinase/FMN adenylyltransferase